MIRIPSFRFLIRVLPTVCVCMHVPVPERPQHSATLLWERSISALRLAQCHPQAGRAAPAAQGGAHGS